MALDVISASTDRDLTTTSALKALVLGATATSTAQDAYLSNLIRRSSKWAESFVGEPLTVQTYRETVASFGRRSLLLGRTPLRSLDAIYDATDTGVATLVSTQCRIEDADAGLLSRDFGWGWTATIQGPGTGGPFYPSALPLESFPLSGQEYKPWLVDYRAGWTYGGVDTGSANYSTARGSTSTGRTLPEDVEQAVLLRAQAMHQNNPDGVSSESLGDLSVSYRDRAGGESVTSYGELLERYRRVV